MGLANLDRRKATTLAWMGRINKTGIVSAGILLFRRPEGRLELLLAHQGGPFWKTKDLGHWTIPKGEVEVGEAWLDVARREFAEETGIDIEISDDLPLGEITQKSGKTVVAWGVEGDLDPALARSNTFSLEWPPRSGQFQDFPEIDRVEWFEPEEARRRLKAAQVPFIDRLEAALDR
jgi:predicted NUDIX family NTP pyrophosphohydrolase